MAGFQHDIAGGDGALRIAALQSPNFDLAAETGWAIMRNGDAWFFNLTAAGAVTSTTVVVRGAGDGVFVYEGTPGPGTLILSIAPAAGTDPYGNSYAGPGLSVSYGGFANTIQIRPDKKAMLVYG